MHVSEYKLIIEDLRKEIDNLRGQVTTTDTNQGIKSEKDTVNSEMYNEVKKIKNEITEI